MPETASTRRELRLMDRRAGHVRREGLGRMPRIEFSISAPEMVCTAAQRVEHDLVHWIDGTMGVLREGDRTLVVSPNGPRPVVHRAGPTGLGDLFASGPAGTTVRILGLPGDVDHASGGPLLRDPVSGRVVLVYHGERFADGDPDRFYSFIGLAVSDDDAASFRDLGAVVSPTTPEEARHLRPIELGAGPIVVVGGQLHLYFVERSASVEWLHLGVARCPVDEVFAAARSGVAPVFHKYSEGRFGEPGLGGAASDLLPGVTSSVLWLDVARLADPDVLVLVYSTFVERIHGRVHFERRVTCSADGLRWTTPTPLDAEPFPAELLYLTIDSGGPDQRLVDTDEFDLYRVVASTRYRWDDARVERQRVRWAVAPEPG